MFDSCWGHDFFFVYQSRNAPPLGAGGLVGKTILDKPASTFAPEDAFVQRCGAKRREVGVGAYEWGGFRRKMSTSQRCRDKKIPFLVSLGMCFLFGVMSLFAQVSQENVSLSEETPVVVSVQESDEKTPPKMVSAEELEAMKTEWEKVREQQIQMIREKEEQLEKLKEEIFDKMKIMKPQKNAEPVKPNPEVSEKSAPVKPESKAAESASPQDSSREIELSAWEKSLSEQEARLEQRREALEVKARQLNEKEIALRAEVDRMANERSVLAQSRKMDIKERESLSPSSSLEKSKNKTDAVSAR